MQNRDFLLSEAEKLIRTRGYAAFSYADLSERVGIRKSSIHHYFASKEILGNVLVDEYLERFQDELATLAKKRISTKSKLRAYGAFFDKGLHNGQMPLCGALAGDVASLPKSLQERVDRFFKLHLSWLESVIEQGIAAGDVRRNINPKQSSMHILSLLQGASLVAWALKDASAIKPLLKHAVANLVE